MSDAMTEGGLPRCPVCGRVGLLALVDPAGAALCARCGEVFVWIHAHLARQLRRDKVMLQLKTRLKDLGLDSLDVVELTMDLEEQFDVAVPDDVAEGWLTIEDLVRWIAQQPDADAA